MLSVTTEVNGTTELCDGIANAISLLQDRLQARAVAPGADTVDQALLDQRIENAKDGDLVQACSLCHRLQMQTSEPLLKGRQNIAGAGHCLHMIGAVGVAIAARRVRLIFSLCEKVYMRANSACQNARLCAKPGSILSAPLPMGRVFSLRNRRQSILYFRKTHRGGPTRAALPIALTGSYTGTVALWPRGDSIECSQAPHSGADVEPCSLPAPTFDVSTPKGIDFVLENSPTPKKYLIETMGGGVALLDYNNDGLLDVFLVNGGKIASDMPLPLNFDRDNPKYWNRLYRQNKDGSFTDVTEAAGLSHAGNGNYGMGVAVGDYDNDGYPDLYVTSYGRTFSIITTATGPLPMLPGRPALKAGGWSGVSWLPRLR